MRVLMFSMARALLGEKTTGDEIERHRRYAETTLSDGREIEELSIVVFAKMGYKPGQLSDKVFVYSTNSRTRSGFFWDAYKIGKNIYKDNPYQLVIGDFLTGLSAWLLKRKFGVKFLMHFHGDFWGNIKGLEGKWHNWFLLIVSKFLARKADGIRVVSSGIKNKLVKKGIDKNKIVVLNTPTSIHLLENPDAGEVQKIMDKYKNKKIILFVGRLEKVRNVPVLIKAFKDIKEIRNKKQETKNKKVLNPKPQASGAVSSDIGQTDCVLVIIGGGSERKKLDGLVEKLRLEKSVFFEGVVSVHEWKNYFKVAEMLVLPSRSESFGNVLALAGAAGLPVVATKTTGARDIIKDKETGLLVPVGNQKKLAVAILELLNDQAKAKEMGEAAKKYCREKFDPETTTRKIVEFWWRIVENKQ